MVVNKPTIIIYSREPDEDLLEMQWLQVFFSRIWEIADYKRKRSRCR